MKADVKIPMMTERSVASSPRHLRKALACMLAVGYAAVHVACVRPSCADLATCVDPLAQDNSPSPDSLLDASSEASPPPAQNPYGRDYPTENLGWTVRSESSPGQIIPNLVFSTGSRPQHVDSSPTLTSLELAEFFDPEARKYEVIVLVLATTLDTGSGPLLNSFSSPPKKVALISVLGEGFPSAPPELDEFSRWVKTYPWVWHALDGLFTELKPLDSENRTIYPVVVLIDARTMELAYRKEGASSLEELTPHIDTIRSRQP